MQCSVYRLPFARLEGSLCPKSSAVALLVKVLCVPQAYHLHDLGKKHNFASHCSVYRLPFARLEGSLCPKNSAVALLVKVLCVPQAYHLHDLGKKHNFASHLFAAVAVHSLAVLVAVVAVPAQSQQEYRHVRNFEFAFWVVPSHTWQKWKLCCL